MMKQHISAMMDGELYDDEADALLNRMKRNSDSSENWDVYHLIGDVLRQPDDVRVGSNQALYEHLRAEPTVLAPQRRTASQSAKWYAVSAAASVGALALVGWMSMQIGDNTMPQVVALQPVVTPAPASAPRTLNDDYLMAHQEFSPGAGMRDAAYARVASGQR
ncbi:MAG: sigma-E factor negative regulatory protein [Gallionellaceae bacterium]|jgi:sigma-E factor negative regulatory protein RseA|nr:sigma-E factor negative regulatory protein [Gallionellaceae bacterium]